MSMLEVRMQMDDYEGPIIYLEGLLYDYSIGETVPAMIRIDNGSDVQMFLIPTNECVPDDEDVVLLDSSTMEGILRHIVKEVRRPIT